MSELKDRLQAAQRRIQRILANPLCSELIQKELTIEFYERPDGSIHHQTPEFSPELIDAFILNYRLLVQTKDGISFRQILPSLGECESLHDSLPDFADDLEKTSDGLNHFLDSASGLRYEDKNLNNRGIVDAFLYGYYSHESEEKRSTLIRWSEANRFEMLHLAFISILKRIIGYLVIFESIFSSALAFLNIEAFSKIYPPKET